LDTTIGGGDRPVIYLVRGFERVEVLGTNKPEWWKPRQFASLAQAKQYADERIETMAPGMHIILEVEERQGPRSRSGKIKYRVEREVSGQIERTPLI
jgi:hypothetical protein